MSDFKILPPVLFTPRIRFMSSQTLQSLIKFILKNIACHNDFTNIKLHFITINLTGSKGIGYAIVEELAGFGARVHACSRNAAELEECRRRWEEKGLHVTASACDVSVRADRERLMDTVRQTFDGKLDILVSSICVCKLWILCVFWIASA